VAEDKIKVLHSGAGRISTIKMRTMSLQEMGLSNKIVNLSNLLAKNQQINHSDESLKLEDYAKCIIKGGWPDNLKKNEINSASMVEDYIEYICAKENVNAKFTIQYQRLKAIIESLARNVAHETSLNTIAIDMRLGSTVPTDETVRSYLDHLTSIFILEELES
jgi:predicted AAA+ superfamily ATPase